MTIMTVLTADNLSYARVEIKGVSVKHYTYNDDIIKYLYNHFKYDEPRKIIFGSENTITHQFLKLIYDKGYEIDEDGTVLEIKKNEICYNTLEHIIEDELTLHTLELHNEYDHDNIAEILLRNGYIISSNISNNKFDISIHGKK